MEETANTKKKFILDTLAKELEVLGKILEYTEKSSFEKEDEPEKFVDFINKRETYIKELKRLERSLEQNACKLLASDPDIIKARASFKNESAKIAMAISEIDKKNKKSAEIMFENLKKQIKNINRGKNLTSAYMTDYQGYEYISSYNVKN